METKKNIFVRNVAGEPYVNMVVNVAVVRTVAEQGYVSMTKINVFVENVIKISIVIMVLLRECVNYVIQT
jgi:hypothetical protein